MRCKALGCERGAANDENGLCLCCDFFYSTTDAYTSHEPPTELTPAQEDLRVDLEVVSVELARLTRQLADTLERLRVVSEEQRSLAESILRSTEPTS
jgi:hypothetical protein